MFKQLKERRSLDVVSLYRTSRMNPLSFEDLIDIETTPYIWGRGDKYYKLAYQFYGDVQYWWVIAIFNNAPTEQHIKIGETIEIPDSAKQIADILGVE
jgi:nucleoid-associated protein YgaU